MPVIALQSCDDAVCFIGRKFSDVALQQQVERARKPFLLLSHAGIAERVNAVTEVAQKCRRLIVVQFVQKSFFGCVPGRDGYEAAALPCVRERVRYTVALLLVVF